MRNFFAAHGRHLMAGAAAFAAAQAVLFLLAGESGTSAGGWFLDSGRGVAAMAIWMGIASAAVGLAWPASGLWRGWMAFTLGAAAALTATLFAIGPGNLFPIVIAIGGGLVAIVAFAGSAVAAVALRMLRPS